MEMVIYRSKDEEEVGKMRREAERIKLKRRNCRKTGKRQ